MRTIAFILAIVAFAAAQERIARARIYRNDASNAYVGELSFHQDFPAGQVKILGDLENLTPGYYVAFIHEYGNLREGCGSTGPVYRERNPPNVETFYESGLGIAGTFDVDEQGKSQVDIANDWMSLGPNEINSILGRGIVIHAGTRYSRSGLIESGDHATSFACGLVLGEQVSTMSTTPRNDVICCNPNGNLTLNILLNRS